MQPKKYTVYMIRIINGYQLTIVPSQTKFKTMVDKVQPHFFSYDSRLQ
jgi:hypothetical protein